VIKKFENFPSNSFSLILVAKFDNLITNDHKILTQKYLHSKELKKSKKLSMTSSEFNNTFDTAALMGMSEKHHSYMNPDFNQKKLHRPTIFSLMAQNGDLFEVYLNLESIQPKLCLQVFFVLKKFRFITSFFRQHLQI